PRDRGGVRATAQTGPRAHGAQRGPAAARVRDRGAADRRPPSGHGPRAHVGEFERPRQRRVAGSCFGPSRAILVAPVGSKYYEGELAYRREMGREFALVHPQTAGLLAERGNDPDVERLLEGFAFLTARIRERVDDAVPAVVHGLVQLLLPHYLRPVPAS